MFYAAPGLPLPCLGDSSDISRGIYLRAACMTAFVVYPEAIIRGWLLLKTTSKIWYYFNVVCTQTVPHWGILKDAVLIKVIRYIIFYYLLNFSH